MIRPLKLLSQLLPEGPEVIRFLKLLPQPSLEGSKSLKLLPKTSPEGPAVSRRLKLLPKTSSQM